jgi:Asp-tRNA(Asn)/Glu-tRNA(Gln) amidotransferase A subunit family amidase
MTELCDVSAVELRRLIGRKKVSPLELLDSCLKRIRATDGAINAMVALDEKGARKAARDAENAVMRGEDLGLLHGLPIGVKDLQDTKGLRTTYGSLIYKDHVPKDDAGMVARLRFEGGIIVGKTNTPEFGAGANTRNRVYGATGNPFDPEKTAAGSSGGSAAALAVSQVPIATGTDYGGSCRTPAAFCGIAGFRPSPGLVPSERPMSLAPFAVAGPMGRTIADLHLQLRAQVDSDKIDPFASSDSENIPESLGNVDLGSIRVAFSTDLGCAPVDENIAGIFEERARTFRSVFAEASNAHPDFANVHDVFEVLRGLVMVSQHRERLEKHRDLLDANVIDNTERGLKYSLADVAWANVEQTKIYKRFLSFFNDHDVLICPAAAVSPFPHEQNAVEMINGEKMPTYMRWLSIAYAPTMALASSAVIPCGVDHLGMPFGIQVMGPNGTDGLVLEVAHALEQVLATNPATVRPMPDLTKLAPK